MEEKNQGREGFTLALALVDAVPVLLFGVSAILIGLLFKSPLFIIGAALTFLGGAGKVTWKLLLAVSKKDVKLLNKQFRYVMIGGFALMLLSVILGWKRISFAAIAAAVTGLPSVIFFVLWICGMITMGVLGKKLDSSVARNNWIEQCVNGCAQLCLTLGLLFLL